MPTREDPKDQRRAIPLDDRSFATGPVGFAVVAALASVVGVALVVWAAGDGFARAAVVGAAFMASAGGFFAMFASYIPGWLSAERHEHEGVAMVGTMAFIGGVLVAWNLDHRIAGAMACGLVAGATAALVRAVRLLRANRGIVDAMAEATAGVRGVDEFADGVELRRDRPPLSSEEIAVRLRTLEVGHRLKVVAWAVASTLVFVAAATLADAGFGAVLVALCGPALVLISGRTWLGRRRAAKSFVSASGGVRRAYVAVVSDHSKALTGICAIWKTNPGIVEGVLERPDELYRCDEEVNDLLSTFTEPVIHEAWVGSRLSDGTPAWIVADHGLAMPLHTWWGGGWWFRHHTRASRPERRVRLTTPEPRQPLPTLTMQESLSPKAMVWGVVWRTLMLSPFLLTGVVGM